MTAYIILVTFLCILSIPKNNKLAFGISITLLFLIGAFRDVSVGTDSANYNTLLTQYGENVAAMHHANEPLFLLIHFLTAINGWGYEGMQLLCMTIVLLFLCVFILKSSSHYQYSLLCYVLLYFYFYSFNTTRQYLAIPFVLLSYYYISSGNKKKYFFCLLIASLFHFSAIITIVVYFLNRYRMPKNIQVILLLSTFIIGLTSLVPSIIGSVMSSTIYETYTESSSFGSRESLFSLSRLLLTFYTVWLVFLLRNKDIYIQIMVVGVSLLNVFAYQAVIGRLAQYFTITQIVLIPNLSLLVINGKNLAPLKITSFIYMFATWLYLISSNVGGVVPWKMFN